MREGPSIFLGEMSPRCHQWGGWRTFGDHLEQVSGGFSVAVGACREVCGFDVQSSRARSITFTFFSVT